MGEPHVDEARLASRVQHPNVVATLDILHEGEHLFLVMDFVLGQALSALAQAPQPRPGAPLLIDTQRSQLEFEVRTRIGQRLQGVFPVYEGLCEVLPDGRHQVRLRLSTAAAEIPDKPRYTAWMRGDSECATGCPKTA